MKSFTLTGTMVKEMTTRILAKELPAPGALLVTTITTNIYDYVGMIIGVIDSYEPVISLGEFLFGEPLYPRVLSSMGVGFTSISHIEEATP